MTRSHGDAEGSLPDFRSAGAGEVSGGQSAPTTPHPDKPRPKPLPVWKVLLHNDDVNAQDYVVRTILGLTPLNQQEAVQRMFEAERGGVSLLLTTHQERAELYHLQFGKRNLTVTIEPA